MAAPIRIRRILLLHLLLLVLAGIVMAVLFDRKIEEYAIAEVEDRARIILHDQRAIHDYVNNVQVQEIDRLKEENALEEGYFSAQLMSFAFISRRVNELFNRYRGRSGMPPIYFKLAAINPRNPVNMADRLEAGLLARMNKEGLQEYREIVRLDGQEYLYLAVPIGRSGPACMACHGQPADAPREMVARYGRHAGFFEAAGDIRALISIRVPLADVLAAAGRTAQLLTLAILALLAGIYALIAFFAFRLDVQRRRIVRQNTELARLSTTDALTGAVNRLGLKARLEENTNSSRRFNHPMAVLLIDLDHFKAINDHYGHPVGDKVLKRLVEVVRQNLRASDILGRWGGEEFLIVSPHLTLDKARTLAEKLRLAVEKAAFPQDIRLTISLGVAEYIPDENTESLIDRVDQALYRAKQGGRNQVAVHAPIPFADE